MTARIAPEFAVLYDYMFDEDNAAVEMTIPYPAAFNPSQIQVALTDDGTGLTVSLPPPHLPLIQCRLFDTATSVNTSSQEAQLIIRLAKATQSRWERLASDFFPSSENIDPKSAYQIGRAKEDPREGISFVTIAAELGYVPAIRHLLDQPPETAPRNADALLALAANVYKDAPSLFELADRTQNRSAAYSLYAEALNRGIVDAGVRMGLMKSPLTPSVSGVPKDGKEAARLFEDVIKRREDPTALHELAQLYYNGAGVSADAQRASGLQARAQAVDPDVAQLTQVIDWVTIGFVGAGLLVAGLVIASVIFRRRRK